MQDEGTITGTNGTETKVPFLVENPRAVGLAFGYSGNGRYARDQDGFKRNAEDVIKLAKMLEACTKYFRIPG